jgi:hypothetical protein
MADDRIGEGEFGRFCTMLDRRLEDLGGKIDLVSDNVTNGFTRTNGRLDKAEDRLTDVEARGCHLLPVHKQMIETLAERAPLSRPKQAGIVAGISGIVVGLLELARTVVAHVLK